MCYCSSGTEQDIFEGMKCIRPTNFGHGETSCGQCLPCRVTRQKEWIGRLEIERLEHPLTSAFITLTYDPAFVPLTDKGLATLDKEQARSWIKRLCVSVKRKYNVNLRYFLVGEYGTKTQRPHYHALIFGLDPLQLEKEIQETWRATEQRKKSTETPSLGFSSIKPMTAGASRYTCGYVLKKLTSEQSFADGRQPEFSLMTRRPALGHSILPKAAKALTRAQLWQSSPHGTPPNPTEMLTSRIISMGFYRLENSIYPMDSVMLDKLCKLLFDTHKIVLSKDYIRNQRERNKQLIAYYEDYPEWVQNVDKKFASIQKSEKILTKQKQKERI